MTKTNVTCKNKGVMMNTLLKFKYMAAGLLAAAAFSLQSCSKDDEAFDVTGSSENVVYINTQSFSPVGAPKNSFLFNVTNTPESSIIANASSITVKFPVQCTQVATEDIHVNFAPDNVLLVEGYSALPSGITATMNKTELVIPKGANISNDSITISVDGNLQLLNTGDYVLATKITAVNGAQPSANLSAAYVLVKAVFTNGVYSGTAPGTVVNKNGLGWTATVNSTNQPYLVDNITTGNTSYYNSGGSPAFPITMEIDTKSSRTIRGFQFYNYNASYATREVNVYTSSAATPTDYVFQGRVALTSAAQQYIRFYGSVECRYVKVEILSGYHSAGQIVIREFNVYL
jgi:hypothetical protein